MNEMNDWRVIILIAILILIIVVVLTLLFLWLRFLNRFMYRLGSNSRKKVIKFIRKRENETDENSSNNENPRR